MDQSGDFDQIILVDKPTGISSFGVVARVRRYLTKQAGHKIKVGHCGTLDPFATGLLILVSGKNTKRAGTIYLGARSSTGDPEGEIEQVSDRQPSLSEIKKVISEFVGKVTQTPPVFSAIKINGRRAYQLARQGREIDMPSRQVTIYDINIESYIYPYLIIKTKVSSGTYIRSLAQDIGEALGVGAYTTQLRRLSVGKYSVSEAKSLENFTVQ